MCTNYNELWHRVITTSPWSWVAHRKPFNDLSRATKHLALSLAIPMLGIESRRFWLFFRTGYIRLAAWLGINRNDWLCTLSYPHQLLLTIPLIYREPFFSFVLRGLKSILTVTLFEINSLSTKLAHASNEESLSCRFCITKQFAFRTKLAKCVGSCTCAEKFARNENVTLTFDRNENISRPKVSDEQRIFLFTSADEIEKKVKHEQTHCEWAKQKTEFKIKEKLSKRSEVFIL